jgi:ribonuclease D
VNFIAFPGKIHLLETDDALAQATPEILGAKTLGFDTETRPSFKVGEVYKTALLQLATDTDAYIVRLHYVKRFDLIKSILENQSIAKVGVAVRDDLKQLQKTFTFEPRNFIELQTVAKEKGLKNFGLKGMTEEVLQAPLTKGPKLTNWQAPTLTDQQLMYAATDAWVGLAIYTKLVGQA